MSKGIDISNALPQVFGNLSIVELDESYINSPMVEADPSITWKDAFAEAKAKYPTAGNPRFARPGERLEGDVNPISFDELVYGRRIQIGTVEVLRSKFVEVATELGAKATYSTVNDKVRELACQEYPALRGCDRVVLFKVSKVEKKQTA